ncbi:MAG: helix-turn-helix transcriptional regulator [Sporichthyaceae bacterium]|nr:helix-turn-helix transcriptional regulator [Sporichthyaceae bacterium]
MTSADHFVRFLDLLPDTLEDPALSAEDLAGRAYVSRFHLDRLVTAAAGEPPGAFRRRLLLERAAHRLVDGATTVLDVAIEAGYGSHEAFTRAFSRAYGITPSALRQAPPHNLELAAPSGVHFVPPGGVCLPAARRATAMDLLIRMIDHHVWLVGEILDRAATLDPAVLDAPVTLSVEGVDDNPSLRQLGVLLVAQEERWLAVAGEGSGPSYEDADVADLQRRHGIAGARFRSLVGRLIEEGRLDDVVLDTLCDPPQEYTFGGIIAHVLNFAAHRRSLALGALASAGVTDLGNGDPRTWVAA